jgi:hypothetical protein
VESSFVATAVGESTKLRLVWVAAYHAPVDAETSRRTASRRVIICVVTSCLLAIGLKKLKEVDGLAIVSIANAKYPHLGLP